jgi:putative membrane protein
VSDTHQTPGGDAPVGPVASPAVPPGPEDGWQRLHPLSPLLRGGVVLLAVIGYAVTQLVDRVLSSIDVGLPGEVPGEVPADVPGDGPLEQVVAYPLLALAILVVVLAAAAFAGWVSWRFSRFRVGSSQVELRTGVLFRQHRQVALERIQAVELSRPLLARATGLAKVVVQAAGGADSSLTLAFLGVSRAEDLRLQLLDLAGHTDERRPGAEAMPGGVAAQVPAAPPQPRPVADGRPLVSVPNGRLFLATILHGSTVFLGVLALAVGASGQLGELGVVFAGVPAILPVAFAVAVGRVRELLTHGNFSLARTETALRVRHGLTDLRHATIPLHRVQAVEVLQPLWWRPWDWWRIRVNVAGVHGAGEDAVETTLLPVGSADDALAVLASLGARRDDPRITEALLGTGGEAGWVGVPKRARWLDPWVWRRAGYLLTPNAVVLRRGRWTRRTAVVPYARVQSLSLAQGPLQQRLRLARAAVVSTPGPVPTQVDHLADADAERFLDVVAARARVARQEVPEDGVRGGGTPVAPLAPGGAPLVD